MPDLDSARRFEHVENALNVAIVGFAHPQHVLDFAGMAAVVANQPGLLAPTALTARTPATSEFHVVRSAC